MVGTWWPRSPSNAWYGSAQRSHINVARVVHQGPGIPLNELIEQGPLVEVSFRPHPVDIEGLASEGAAWEPIVHKMMIDTGAQVTVVEETVPQFLSLVPTRYQAIAGVTGDLNC